MREIKFDLDYDKLAAAIRDPHKPWYAPEKLRSTLQGAALILGAIWLFYLSVSLQEESNHIGLELLKNQQAQADLEKTIGELAAQQSKSGGAGDTEGVNVKFQKQLECKENFVIE